MRVDRQRLLLVVALILALLLARDVSSLFLHSPPGVECEEYVIYDVYGLLSDRYSSDECYFTGITVDDLKAIHRLRAEKVILVTHYFYSGDTVGIGVSEEPTVWTVFKYPLTSFMLAIGDAGDGSEYIAVKPSAFKYLVKLDGKIVYLISCSWNIEPMVNAMLESGARMVIVSDTPALLPDDAYYYVERALVEDIDTICSSVDFKCYVAESSG